MLLVSSLKIVDRKAEAAVGNALNTTASTAALIPPAAPVDASLRFSVDRNSSPLPPLTESRDELNYSLLDNSAFVHGRSSSALDGTAQVLMGTRNISQESLPLSASPSKSSLGETFDKDERISRAR